MRCAPAEFIVLVQRRARPLARGRVVRAVATSSAARELRIDAAVDASAASRHETPRLVARVAPPQTARVETLLARHRAQRAAAAAPSS